MNPLPRIIVRSTNEIPFYNPCDGCQGPRGYQGLRGHQGNSGIGTQGYQGISGIGTQGNQGISGIGTQGNQGYQGVPGSLGASDNTYVHTQSSSSATWNINHSMNKYPCVFSFDSSEDQVFGEIEYVDTNNVVITFSQSISGTAYLN